MNKEHLVPDLIKDIINKLILAKSQNEIYLLEERLRAIRNAIDDALNKKNVSNNIQRMGKFSR